MPRPEKIRLRSAQLKDEFGDPLPDLDQPDWREVSADAVVPRSAGDWEQRGPIIITGFLVKLKPSVEIYDTDEVEIRGRLHQIDGAVGDYVKTKLFYTVRVN